MIVKPREHDLGEPLMRHPRHPVHAVGERIRIRQGAVIEYPAPHNDVHIDVWIDQHLAAAGKNARIGGEPNGDNQAARGIQELRRHCDGRHCNGFTCCPNHEY